MRLSELREQWKRDPRRVELKLSTPALIIERSGRKSDEVWERTTALVVGQQPAPPDPELHFVEKANRQSNPFTMGVTLGRVESNDIVVDDSGISRFHAWLQFDERLKTWMVCDADSKNGTVLNGEPIAKGSRVPLTDGAIISIGQASLRFVMPVSLLEMLKKEH